MPARDQVPRLYPPTSIWLSDFTPPPPEPVVSVPCVSTALQFWSYQEKVMYICSVYFVGSEVMESDVKQM
jgi:hypothetical protein